jgi:hypothetical protein
MLAEGSIQQRRLLVPLILGMILVILSLLMPQLSIADTLQQIVTDATEQSASLQNSDQRVLIVPPSGGGTLTAQLFTDLPFSCPRGRRTCTASIALSTAHNCVPQNVILANLQIDGQTIPNTGAITEFRLCNPNDANGNFDNLTSYTWVVTDLEAGRHTANILLTYQATDGTGIGFDHQTLVVTTYTSRER